MKFKVSENIDLSEESMLDELNRQHILLVSDYDYIPARSYTDYLLNENFRYIDRTIPKELKEVGRVNMVGHHIDSVEDLANLFTIFRSRRYETFRIVFIKDNTIVGMESMTSKMPGYAPTYKYYKNSNINQSASKTLVHLKTKYARLDADGYYLFHNHPSGRIEPSNNDIETTKGFINYLPGFIGHIIEGTEQFSFIDKALNVSVFDLDDKLNVDSLGKVSSPTAVAKFARHYAFDDNVSLVIYVTAGNDITAVEEVDNYEFKEKGIDKYLSNQLRDNGAYVAFLITKSFDVIKDATKLSAQGIFRDIIVINDDGSIFSYCEKGKLPYQVMNKIIKVYNEGLDEGFFTEGWEKDFDNKLEERIVKKGSKWQVQSEKGRNMGTYDTKAEAKKRLGQVEYFKHKNEGVIPSLHFSTLLENDNYFALEDEKNRIRDVLNIIKDIQYGFISKKDGKVITDREWIHNTPNISEFYEVNTDPKITIKNKLGLCKDQAIAIRYLMNKLHPEDNVILYSLIKHPKAHCVPCYCHDNKYYYIENAWDKEKGFYGPFDSKEELEDYLEYIYEENHRDDTPKTSKVIVKETDLGSMGLEEAKKKKKKKQSGGLGGALWMFPDPKSSWELFNHVQGSDKYPDPEKSNIGDASGTITSDGQVSGDTGAVTGGGDAGASAGGACGESLQESKYPLIDNSDKDEINEFEQDIQDNPDVLNEAIALSKGLHVSPHKIHLLDDDELHDLVKKNGLYGAFNYEMIYQVGHNAWWVLPWIRATDELAEIKTSDPEFLDKLSLDIMLYCTDDDGFKNDVKDSIEDDIINETEIAKFESMLANKILSKSDCQTIGELVDAGLIDRNDYPDQEDDDIPVDWEDHPEFFPINDHISDLAEVVLDNVDDYAEYFIDYNGEGDFRFVVKNNGLFNYDTWARNFADLEKEVPNIYKDISDKYPVKVVTYKDYNDLRGDYYLICVADNLTPRDDIELEALEEATLYKPATTNDLAAKEEAVKILNDNGIDSFITKSGRLAFDYYNGYGAKGILEKHGLILKGVGQYRHSNGKIPYDILTYPTVIDKRPKDIELESLLEHKGDEEEYELVLNKQELDFINSHMNEFGNNGAFDGHDEGFDDSSKLTYCKIKMKAIAENNFTWEKESDLADKDLDINLVFMIDYTNADGDHFQTGSKEVYVDWVQENEDYYEDNSYYPQIEEADNYNYTYNDQFIDRIYHAEYDWIDYCLSRFIEEQESANHIEKDIELESINDYNNKHWKENLDIFVDYMKDEYPGRYSYVVKDSNESHTQGKHLYVGKAYMDNMTSEEKIMWDANTVYSPTIHLFFDKTGIENDRNHHWTYEELASENPGLNFVIEDDVELESLVNESTKEEADKAFPKFLAYKKGYQEGDLGWGWDDSDFKHAKDTYNKWHIVSVYGGDIGFNLKEDERNDVPSFIGIFDDEMYIYNIDLYYDLLTNIMHFTFYTEEYKRNSKQTIEKHLTYAEALKLFDWNNMTDWILDAIKELKEPDIELESLTESVNIDNTGMATIEQIDKDKIIDILKSDNSISEDELNTVINKKDTEWQIKDYDKLWVDSEFICQLPGGLENV